jgi:DNA-directed RNA polymerase subunit M/transcription elongation factor TFIIS
MAITISCPGCEAQLRVRADFVGKSIKCPQCSKVVRVEEPLEEAPLDDDAPVVKPARSKRLGDEEEKPRRRQLVEDEEDDGEEERGGRPRKKKGKYVPCPSCGGRDATRVMWTFWGSFYGPAMFTHVRCPDCGATFNGRSGRSNLIPAVIFVTLPLLFIGLILVSLAWFVILPRFQRKVELPLQAPDRALVVAGAVAGGPLFHGHSV